MFEYSRKLVQATERFPVGRGGDTDVNLVGGMMRERERERARKKNIRGGNLIPIRSR